MLTLSVVSHGQVQLVEALLDDLARLANPRLSEVLLTLNVPEREPRTPPGLRVKVLRNTAPRGFGANHNAAFRHVKTPLFAIVNPDIRLPDDPLPALIEAFNDAAVALVAPRIVNTQGHPEDAARLLITPWEIVLRRVRRQAAPAYPAWLAGMFLVCRSETFRLVGGFDERYFMYCEDFDLSARVRLAGGHLRVCPRAVAVHAAQRASHRSLRHLRWHLTSLMRMWSSAAFWRYRALLASEPHPFT
ncbi:MAG TPA: glycosyltransferase [Burkholderiaceae bacterium]|nr:glycosyltransferase [Burkholderiaceae bacterium]